jgi:hypothetical protein
MYLSCIQKQIDSGLPKIICDGNYKLNKCLYLDSAEYLLHGNGGGWGPFFNGLGEALKSSGLGLAIQTGYTWYCWSDFIPAGNLKDSIFVKGGFHSAFCGTVGAAFGMKDLIDTIKNPFNGMRTMNPGDKDYCAGLDYSEASSGTATDGGTFSD